ncbi:MAG: hypothetical protein ABIK18_04520 [candidate division WOR-3 bacterium]
MLRFIFSNLPLKIISFFFALFLWVTAVLDRTYEINLSVPVSVIEKGKEERVITDVDTKNALVTLTGKGRELFRLRRKKLMFHPVVPEGKFGTRQIRLNPADLKLPQGITLRSIEPEVIEVKLGPATTREVKVVVPTKGEPGKGLMLSSVQVKTPVKLVGPADEIESYSTVYTETLNLREVNPWERRWLKLLPPADKGFFCVPDSVEVEVVLVPEKARIFLGVPVKVIAPPTIEVTVEPPEAQIAIAGPAEKIDSLRTSDVVVSIKIPGSAPGVYRLSPEVVLPEGYRVVKCEPELFQVTIR